MKTYMLMMMMIGYEYIPSESSETEFTMVPRLQISKKKWQKNETLRSKMTTCLPKEKREKSFRPAERRTSSSAS